MPGDHSVSENPPSSSSHPFNRWRNRALACPNANIPQWKSWDARPGPSEERACGLRHTPLLDPSGLQGALWRPTDKAEGPEPRVRCLARRDLPHWIQTMRGPLPPALEDAPPSPDSSASPTGLYWRFPPWRRPPEPPAKPGATSAPRGLDCPCQVTLCSCHLFPDSLTRHQTTQAGLCRAHQGVFRAPQGLQCIPGSPACRRVATELQGQRAPC